MTVGENTFPFDKFIFACVSVLLWRSVKTCRKALLEKKHGAFGE
jgi:hypothetical protein